MIDYRQLYIDLIHDYDPFTDISEHENLTDSEMLYNLIEIRDNNELDSFIHEEDVYIFNRFNELISLFEQLGISPYYD